MGSRLGYAFARYTDFFMHFHYELHFTLGGARIVSRG